MAENNTTITFYPNDKRAWNGDFPDEQYKYLGQANQKELRSFSPQGYGESLAVNYDPDAEKVWFTQNGRSVPATKQQIASLQRYFANLKNNYNNQQQQPTAIATQKQGGQINYLNLYE